LYASGASDDIIYEYAWKQGAAKPKRKLSLSSGADSGKTARTPAGIALS
jgi:hypothetical protein